MNKFFLKIAVVFMLFMSFGATAQSDYVCLELTVDGESSVIVVTSNIVEETQAALADEGIESSIVECEDDYPTDWDDDWDNDWDWDGELVCVEITVDGETKIMVVTADMLEEFQAELAEEGIESTVVECEDDYPTDWDDDWDNDWDNDWDWDGELVCVEITVDGETKIMVVTADMLEEFQAELAEEGIESTVVECEDDWDNDWDNDWDDWDYEGELVCLQITVDGETCVIVVSENIVEETVAELENEGIEAVVVDCDENIDIPDWDNEDEFEFGEEVCLEVTIDGETKVLTIPEELLEEFQAGLADEGIESSVVECEDGPELPDTPAYENTVKASKAIDLSGFNITPNPSSLQDDIRINFESSSETDVNVQVVNQLGQLISNNQLTTNKGNNVIELSTNNMSVGLYYITISNGRDINVTNRLMITK